MPPVLLAVKFFIPKPRPTLVDRPDLLNRFSVGLGRSLTLLSAPAGFGKSTLLSSWLERQAARSGPDAREGIFCWLSLDPLDNQAARFWTYLVAAIQTGVQERQLEKGAPPGLRLDHLLEYLQSDPSPLILTILDELLNTISASAERVMLVLDDFHVIQASEIHEQITYLLEHLPPNLHLIISTRSDPPLPIARLRARGQLNEFRAADLRFSVSEAEKFFQNVMGLTMGGEDITAIQTSTEGWVAGIQMAALALQAVMTENSLIDIEAKQEKIKEFVGSFSGKHLYILDYLTDEVFNHQSEEVQSFLLKTSILERMSVGLCEAVLHNDADDREASQAAEGAPPTKASAILNYLEKSSLFLVRLDHERLWFRYHHLFADLLRARLGQTWPGIIPDLHRNASHWYEQNGLVDDAIQHAMAATDWEWAAWLMETYVTAYLERGQLAAVLRWIDSLPNAVLRSRPVLCAPVAMALAHAGQFQRVPALLDTIEEALFAVEKQKIEAVSLFLTRQALIQVQGTVAVLRAFGNILNGNPEQALQLGKNALESISGLEPRELAWLNWVCGYAYRAKGELDQAIHFHEIAFDISRKTNALWEEMSIELGIAYRFQGKLEQAVEVFQKTLIQVEEQGMRNKGNLSRLEACLSATLFDQNRLDEALQHIQKGVYYLQWWPSHNHITTAYIYLGQVLLGMGRLDEAAEAIQRAEQEQYKGQVLPTVLSLVEKISIQLWVKRRNWDLLERWLAEQNTAIPDFYPEGRLFNEYEGMHQVSLARAWIAKGRKEAATLWFEQAFQLLSQLETLAKRSHWVHTLIEIHLLQSVALHEMGKNGVYGAGNAMDYLTYSLELGLPAGFLRIYLQEGATAADMLQAWLKSTKPLSQHTDLKPSMIKNLLDLFGLDQTAGAVRAKIILIEPLTEREQEVLQLLAFGLSNKELAARLIVSEGTIKTHVHNVIGKLGANSRTHAIVRAKELDLL